MREFIIIGAGQAGLSMAYYLKQEGVDFLVLDANEEVGASWLQRWDSLRLFTPSEYNHLPGMIFPCEKGHYPSKYQVSDYFKRYVMEYNISIKFGKKIIKLEKIGDYFVLKTHEETFLAKNAIVAVGPLGDPYIPEFHKKISKDINQLHSKFYKNPEDLLSGDTLVVGSGDSGAQILQDIKDGNRKIYFSGSSDIIAMPQEMLGKTAWWWYEKFGLLSIDKYTWAGKKLKKHFQLLIGYNVRKIARKNNVSLVGKTIGAKGNTIFFEKTKINSIENIIWATGYTPNFQWIKNISLDEAGYPKNYRGISDTEGLYFIGLPWLYTRGSATLGGVKKDAQYLVSHIIKNVCL